MHGVFDFTGFEYDEKNGVLQLHYKVFTSDCQNEEPPYFFTEKITFEGRREPLTSAKKTVLNRLFKELHIAAGISYYKAFLSPRITFSSYPLTKEEADFFNVFYVKGLGEFAYRNNVTVSPCFKSNAASDDSRPLPDITLSKRCLTAVGGGKDSAVTIELLRQKGIPCTLFSMGNHKAITATVAAAALPCITVQRELSPLLLELNKQGKVLNGHIPITGILSFILLAAAVIYDFDSVVMSTERSANIGNTYKDGWLVNHQWSKSMEFENMLIKFLHGNITPSLNYFSLLRPYSELKIASMFAALPRYYNVFTSCNHAFKYIKENRTLNWCGDCDKCRFVYLILAPFLQRQKLAKIFGSDMLDNPENEKGYMELLGLSGFKPFECVGEVEECVAALFLLKDKKEWEDAFIVKNLLPKVSEKYGQQACLDFIRQAFTDSDIHNIPKGLK